MEKRKVIKGRLRKLKVVSNEHTYDIQTETQNFFANGLLVHNSEIILRPFEFCNLSEIVVRADDDVESLKRKAYLATIIGTLQSTLTDFRYINRKWKNNCDEERLLGVSLTGICDNKLLNKPSQKLADALDAIRTHCVETNKEFAEILGIPVSAAITCVKPSGCADIETKIKTSNGVMSLSEVFEYMGYDITQHNQGEWLEPTKELFVYDENNDLKPITKLFVNGFAETYELTDELGNKYEFTGEHKVKVVGKGWVRVDELNEGDDVVKF